MAIVYSQYFETRLDGDIDDSQTSIALLDANRLPDLDPGDWCYLTLYNQNTAEYEVIQVTAVDKANSTITCVRGFSSTTALAFTEEECVVLRWPTASDWEDLRTEIEAYATTQADIDTAIADFRDTDEINDMLDTSLAPYETKADFDTKIKDFRIENEIQNQINTSIKADAYVTELDMQQITQEVFNQKVIDDELQSEGQVQQKIDAALEDENGLSEVKTTKDNKTIGTLSGSGTASDPLKVDWGGYDPTLVDDIAANTTHRGLTNNPHNTDDEDIRSLNIDTPVFTTFEPTLDDHPATKIYVDDAIINVSENFKLDLNDVGQQSGSVILGEDSGTPGLFYLYCWQRYETASLSYIGQGQYTVPLSTPLDAAPDDIEIILNVSNQTDANRKRMAQRVYVSDITATDFVANIDTGKDAQGFHYNDMILEVSYYGKLTI